MHWAERAQQAAEQSGAGMDRRDVARRVLAQRMERYTDPGPPLVSTGTARFRQEPSRLRFARLRHVQVQWSVVPERHGEQALGPALTAAGFSLAEDLLLMAHEGPLQAPLN